MGIGRQGAKDLLVALRTGTTGKRRLREEIIDAVAVLSDKLIAMESQRHQALTGFAESRQSQFDTFIDALSEVGEPGPNSLPK